MNDDFEKHLEAFIFSRKAAMRSDETIACYDYSLQGLAKFVEGWPPTANDVRRFLADCGARGLSKVTVCDHWERLSVCFKWFVDEGCLAAADNPMNRVDKPSVPKLLPRGPHPSDVQTLLEHLRQAVASDQDDPWKKRDLAMVSFLFDTGVRNKEVRLLKRCDLHLQQRGAVVRGKADNERIITFGVQTKSDLELWLAVHPGGDLVFVTTTGKEMDRFDVRRVVKKATDAAGITNRITPHMFRHAATLALLDLGSNPVDVQGQMGHQDLSMTEHYAQATVGHRRYLHDRCSPLDRLDDLAKMAW